MISFEINGVQVDLDVQPDQPLLWVIRGPLRLTGTKYGCGIGACGCCTVHVDGKPVRACVTSVGKVQGKKVTTIEGIPENHPLKVAWVEEQVPQCGYCQSGQIMQAAALLSENPNPADEEIVKAMDGNLCRCGSYPRIMKAIRRAAGKGAGT
ncbi:MAG: (2Fe-2S)-binding protein [Syntrophobacteraceae bacterium]|nr:(2Fe-2S)-binding protein [Desulfobacteraceae bacterium]